jgi:hypothetical protein
LGGYIVKNYSVRVPLSAQSAMVHIIVLKLNDELTFEIYKYVSYYTTQTASTRTFSINCCDRIKCANDSIQVPMIGVDYISMQNL